MKKLYKKILKKYVVHLIILFFIANTDVALLIFTKAANDPHKGHDCGINVDSIMPNLHFLGSVLTKVNNAKITNFCSQNTTPTENPTQQPTATATSNSTTKPTDKATEKAVTQPTVSPTQEAVATSSPTSSSVSYSGNTFGEILGKPNPVRSDRPLFPYLG